MIDYLDKIYEFHDNEGTRAEWLFIVLILFCLETSQSWTSAELVPTAKMLPSVNQDTEDM